ncbi:hypothetical protein Y1Q_0020195 [Alligator mississippiensis]|uniref:Integrin beta n=1 Tax=Alligator mississippiensis TaxID=8496 RepID=A0A151NRK7_ALLMI|nr:hypothetical protein Y1Q_0020195 [Alligator mississippiensis]
MGAWVASTCQVMGAATLALMASMPRAMSTWVLGKGAAWGVEQGSGASASLSCPHLQKLSKLIPKSVVGELKEDSSNVVQLIADAYNSLSSTVELQHSALPPGVSVTYESHCGPGAEEAGPPQAEGGRCSGVHINEQVEFWVTVRAGACLQGTQGFTLRVLGLAEELHVALETSCGCDCGPSLPRAPHCADLGNLTCGVCSCPAGRVGRHCECDAAEQGAAGHGCRVANGTGPACSGRGRCVCGRCECDPHVRGDRCECDDAGCERHSGRLCAGHGQCVCGMCQCEPDYMGSACECSRNTSACKQDGQECSGHGRCMCNHTGMGLGAKGRGQRCGGKGQGSKSGDKGQQAET